MDSDTKRFIIRTYSEWLERQGVASNFAYIDNAFSLVSFLDKAGAFHDMSDNEWERRLKGV